MTFTNGTDQMYETMMKEMPNSRKKSDGRYNPKFKYSYKDLDCRYCIEYRKCPLNRLCPYILDNLPDLTQDGDFITAVTESETCKTPHRLTLLYLNENILNRIKTNTKNS
jgi:hypothetical protein